MHEDDDVNVRLVAEENLNKLLRVFYLFILFYLFYCFILLFYSILRYLFYFINNIRLVAEEN
jgi:hypothetical protein